MNRAKALLGLSILMIAAILLSGVGFAAPPSALTPATTPAASAAPRPAATQPAYFLWDGKESMADYAKWAGIRDVQIALALDGNVTLKLALIPAGKFTMGSPAGEKGRFDDEGDQHEVTISHPFYMGACEVKRGQFARFIRDSGYQTEAEKDGKGWGWNGTKFGDMAGYSWRKTGFEQTDDHPVVNVTWNDAAAFCQWAGRKTGRKVWLPTEAQWAYAGRAGAKTAYLWGNDPNGGKGWANAADQTAKKTFAAKLTYFSWDDGYAFTSPVGTFKATAFGLHDMIGNACEWCADWFDGKNYVDANATDPQGPPSGVNGIIRGSGWHDGPLNCRTAFRSMYSPVFRSSSVGFRVAVELK